jgi:DNA repair exonuclease SbcCD ATPase subunit
MIRIKDLTVKNFMSVGNQTQAVNFNREQLTLVLGENLDQGGDDSGSRNGTGKTTIINALSRMHCTGKHLQTSSVTT